MAPDSVGPVPVLVDFGLAGRKVRPGCASPYYGAPEVWDAGVFQMSTRPHRGGRLRLLLPGLRDAHGHAAVRGRHLPSLISGHLAHNGNPAGLTALRSPIGSSRRSATILAAGLARDPRRRASMGQVREALRTIAPQLQNATWPLAA